MVKKGTNHTCYLLRKKKPGGGSSLKGKGEGKH